MVMMGDVLCIFGGLLWLMDVFVVELFVGILLFGY